MERKSVKRAVAIIAAMCVFGTSCLLCGCVDLYGEEEYEYMIEYMDAIQITCSDYKLADRDDSKYSSSTDGDPDTIIIAGIEKKIDIKLHTSKDFSITIDEEVVEINEEFMAEKSSEYVTITEMWFRYDDRMDKYYDTIPGYYVNIFDNCIFIRTRFKRGGSAWWFRYQCSMPTCLFKYDIENDAVLYCGYLINDSMSGDVQIEKVE